MDNLALEALLEEVISKVTERSTSVAILGQEVSVNIEGEVHHFVMKEDGLASSRIMGQWWYGRQGR